MSTLFIKNAKAIITCDNEDKVFENGNIYILKMEL